MSDLIDRQAAKEAIRDKFKDLPSRCEINEVLNGLPSVQPERKKGKWIIKDNPGTGWYRVTCSECGEDVTSTAPCIGFFPDAKVNWSYCPHCGAMMEGEQDE